MANVTLTWKDGTVEHLEDHGAPGGSYSQSVRYEGVFVIITNAYGKERAIPAADIKEISVEGPRRW